MNFKEIDLLDNIPEEDRDKFILLAGKNSKGQDTMIVVKWSNLLEGDPADGKPLWGWVVCSAPQIDENTKRYYATVEVPSCQQLDKV